MKTENDLAESNPAERLACSSRDAQRDQQQIADTSTLVALIGDHGAGGPSHATLTGQPAVMRATTVSPGMSITRSDRLRSRALESGTTGPPR
jgi:hypothetical protein